MPFSSTQDELAGEILAKFDRLPAKYKPAVEATGLSNWVPLSGIALVDDSQHIEVVALASTGMKCLPSTSIKDLDGLALHDSHAEILALRLFNHFLLKECHKMAVDPKYNSPFVQKRTSNDHQSTGTSDRPFSIRPRWCIWMYCSEAPCGDSSMELIMAQQADATPWTTSKPTLRPSPPPLSSPPLASSASPNADVVTHPTLLGRGYFSELGAVRRKPARGDSPPTLSKSCTDKLAMKQCTSVLSSTTSLLVAPESAYLHTLVLPQSQYVSTACERAFGAHGRMAGVAGRAWEAGFGFRAFDIKTTQAEFRYSRRALDDAGPHAGPGSKPSNIAAAWNRHGEEVIINGVLQGRKNGDPRGASKISRRRMAELIVETSARLLYPCTDNGLESVSAYSGLKGLAALDARRSVKSDAVRQALQGWVANTQDDFPLQGKRSSRGE